VACSRVNFAFYIFMFTFMCLNSSGALAWCCQDDQKSRISYCILSLEEGSIRCPKRSDMKEFLSKFVILLCVKHSNLAVLPSLSPHDLSVSLNLV
jgi:hypothetical protein